MIPEAKPLPGRLIRVVQYGGDDENSYGFSYDDSASSFRIVINNDLESYIKQREERAWNACQRFYLNSELSYEIKTPGTGLYYSGWEKHFKDWTESEEYSK